MLATATPARPAGRSAGLACLVAFAAAAPVVASAHASPRPLPLLAGAALFLFVAVAHDVHRRRIPNWLTASGFAAALAWATWSGAGPAVALLGGATAFAVLALPYALGAIGAGDVKTAIVIGAGFGAAAIAALGLAALAGGGALALLRGGRRAGVRFAIALSLALAGAQLAG